MTKILVINAGSSSVKFQLYNYPNQVIAKGLCERIFVDGNFTIEINDKKDTQAITMNSHKDAIEVILNSLKVNKLINNYDEINIIGHRVVQGGSVYKESILINDEVIKQLENLSKLAPLHNPGAVNVMKIFKTLCPKAENVAVFDTSFHQTMPDTNYIYPLPYSWYQDYSVRKYGMHGTSSRFIVQKLKKELNLKEGNIINCHLGNGASITAIKNWKCFNTSMGLTPLAGIMMGTRSGDIDPAILEYMAKATNKDVFELTNILNKESGLLGVSGISSDMRDVIAAAGKGNKRAELALNIYVSKIVNYISMYLNDLENKTEVIVFTAGIGENASLIRERIIEKLHIVQVEIDREINNKRSSDMRKISTNNSKIDVYVVPTDEEIMIAKDAYNISQR